MFHPEILGVPQSRVVKWVGKIGDFQTLSHHISETVQDRTKLRLLLIGMCTRAFHWYQNQ